ncbi:hypothetical protein [Methylobacterium indicum]|uniref:hypothetical protein n=1 Tax=Methylobacterium indicum TaxID=1775910 RepID=UPI0024359ED8|nr:hypothetical protein [Methylobacterium indicum]
MNEHIKPSKISGSKARGNMPKHNPDRPPSDFYPTPDYATTAILQAEPFPGVIWEPACGDGAMVEVMKKFGHERVIPTEKYFWDYGEMGVDFLTSSRDCDHIVTNPPFNLAEEFARHALAVARWKVALFLPLTFLEAEERRGFFKNYPPARVHVFCKRVTLYPKNHSDDSKGRGGRAHAWFVWDKTHIGPSCLCWL